MNTELVTTSTNPRAVYVTRLWSRHRSDILGISWVVLFALLYLSPALKDGFNFGPSDLGAGLSVFTNHVFGTGVHNSINGDIITQEVPWTVLDWHDVHSAVFPLWNPFSGTGLPQFLNFESAVLSLPTLISYVFPLAGAYLVVVCSKLLIAGIGTYVFVRVLGARSAGAAFAATSYMLCGAFSNWLGWAVSGPLAWVGFIAAGLVLCYRSPRLRWVALLAVSVAFSIYGGFPESNVLMAGALIALFVAGAAMMLAAKQRLSGRGVTTIIAGVGSGALLAAPLWLPGLSLIHQSARDTKVPSSGLPLHALVLAFAQGYDGLPIKGSAFFGPLDYYESAAYLGVIAIVFALVALFAAPRRPAVFGLFIAGLFSLGVIYDLGHGAPIQHLVKDVGLGSIALQRMLPLVGFLVAALAGLGLDLAIKGWREPKMQQIAFVSSILVALVLAFMWLKVASARFLATATAPAQTSASSLRASSLWWPSAEILAVLLAIALASRSRQRGVHRLVERGVVLAIVALQSAYLLFAGIGLNSYSTSAFPETPAVATLQRVVGTKLVALDGPNRICPGVTPYCGIRQWEGIGIYPEMNVAYGVDELAMHDPLMPASYFSSWPVPNSGQVFSGNLNLFVPSVDSITLARRYGVSYLIVPSGTKPPAGTTKVAMLLAPVAGKGEIDLYHVPDSSPFTLASSRDHVIRVERNGDRTYVVKMSAPVATSATFRVTDVPGWHASADGKPLVLRDVDGAFLTTTVPAGTRQVVFSYLPRNLWFGLVLAIADFGALIGWGVFSLVRRRKSPSATTGN